MDSIISIFHIDWQIMAAQIVNFAIVVAVLWFFAFKPLNKKMGERTKTIQKSLDDARQITNELQETEQKKMETLRQSRQEAQKIVEEATVLARGEKDRYLALAKNEVEKVIAEGKERLKSEEARMIRDVKIQSAELVTMMTEKVLAKISDKKVSDKLVNDAIKEIK